MAKQTYRQRKGEFQRKEKGFHAEQIARGNPEPIFVHNLVTNDPKFGWFTFKGFSNALYIERRYSMLVYAFIDHPEWTALLAGLQQDRFLQPLCDWLQEHDIGDAEFKAALVKVQETVTNPPVIED